MIFTRQIDGDVVVAGSLRASFAAAGVPATALLEAERAFGTTVDLVRDPRDGDRLHVSYEQGFTIAGNPVGVPKLLWAAFQPTNKPAIAVHRFRPNGGAEQFWLTDGESTAAPRLQMPVEGAAVSSPSACAAPLPSLTASFPGPPARPPPPLYASIRDRRRWRDQRGFDLGGLAVCRPFRTVEPDRDRRRKRLSGDGQHQRSDEPGQYRRQAVAFGFETREVDGHDEAGAGADSRRLTRHPCHGPKAIVARTVKGKGMSFMEHDNRWHYTRLSPETYAAAMAELDAAGTAKEAA